MRLLLVEDDIRFAGVLVSELRRLGYEVDHVTDGIEALGAPPVDLVLLDLGLPDGDGLRICRRLRRFSSVAIIVLSARAAEGDRVAALRGGADDYLVKPFGMAELSARIEAVMRRVGPRPGGVRQVGPLSVDFGLHRVTAGTDEVELTPKEFQLLVVLAGGRGGVVTRDRLLSQVWQTSWAGASRTLDVHVGTLRHKLGGWIDIHTVRGVGYRLGDPDDYADSGDEVA